MPLEPDDDARWLAFLYVCGELADDARAAFEARLDRDQEAREAVAEAVGLAEAVAMLPPGLGSAPSHPIRLAPPARRLAWLAAAACLVAATVPALRGLLPAAPKPPASALASAPDPRPSGEVALAWSDLVTSGDAGEPELISWIGAASAPEASDAAPAADAATSPPSWLLLAASAPAADRDQAERHED